MSYRKTSKKGIELIKKFEGFESLPYECPAGLPTIGYGHLIKSYESFPDELTKKEAEELLLEDVEFAENCVFKNVDVKLSDSQYAALVSFVFNIGARAFKESTLLKKLNGGDYDSVPGELARWKYANKQVLPGLVRRRAAESELFIAG